MKNILFPTVNLTNKKTLCLNVPFPMEKCSTVECDIVILITTPIFQQPRNHHPYLLRIHNADADG